MFARLGRVSVLALVVGCGWLAVGAVGASASVTPGWECVPTAAGQPVLSGGTGSAPSCGPNTTAVLAPTYVSSGVAGKPTVQFASVNVQILNGTGATSGVNGLGNLVLGYDENPSNHTQTGSHDLVLGEDDGFTSYGDLVAGYGDYATEPFATALGWTNKASGYGSLVAGHLNTATGSADSVTGGESNIAYGLYSAISGGAYNQARYNWNSVTGGEHNETSENGGFTGASISGGAYNDVEAEDSSISGGEYNTIAGNEDSSIAGGCSNYLGFVASVPVNSVCTTVVPAGTAAPFLSIFGGVGNNVTSQASTILAGEGNSITGGFADSVAGGSSESLSSPTNYLSRIGSTSFTP